MATDKTDQGQNQDQKVVSYLFMGMTNMRDATDIDPDEQLAVDLVNVDCNNSGFVSRRKGYSRLSTLPMVAGWSDGVVAYLADADYLYSFDGVTPRQIYGFDGKEAPCFCKINTLVGCFTEVDFLILEGGVVLTNTPLVDQFMEPMVSGQCCEFYNGRLYIARGNTLYCSKAHDIFTRDKRKNVVATFKDKITMIRKTSSGLFVGTHRETWFIAGDDPFEDTAFNIELKAQYGVIAGTDCFVDAQKVKQGAASDAGAIWSSHQGICFGHGNGSFENLSLHVVSYPFDLVGAGMIREKNGLYQYVSTFAPRYVSANKTEVQTLDINEV